LAEATTVDVVGKRVRLTNLTKVLYPKVGFTKAEVASYYAAIAPVMLPHVESRALTFTRWPNGVAAASFSEKNRPRHAPETRMRSKLTCRWKGWVPRDANNPRF